MRQRRRRLPVVLAAVLTVVILLGFGGYTAWNEVFGDDGETTSPTVTAPVVYEDAIGKSLFVAYGVVQSGRDVHLVVDLGQFLESTNRSLFQLGVERAALEALLPKLSGTRADIVGSSIDALDELGVALTRWRDAVFNVRLASVDDARASIDAAVTRLQADLDRWKSLSA